jgi:hypothetical protein
MPGRSRHTANASRARQTVTMSEFTSGFSAVVPVAVPEEAAAIVAAVERFVRATARPPSQQAPAPDGWRRAALLEGVSRDPGDDVPDPWINT